MGAREYTGSLCIFRSVKEDTIRNRKIWHGEIQFQLKKNYCFPFSAFRTHILPGFAFTLSFRTAGPGPL